MTTALRLAFENVRVTRKTNQRLAVRVIERMHAQDKRTDRARKEKAKRG
jgi:hypothetical protein